MQWLDITEQVVTLLVALVSLISAGAGVFFGIKAVIEKNKDKSAAELWTWCMSICDAAIKAAEKSGKSGADKKQMVIDTINAAAKEAGVDVSGFMTQLVAYIDNTIKFTNDMIELGKKNK